jgi:GntR family transcriptional regulator, transcriptional repressor for pyruvate dehydrogenase complex
VRPEQGSARYPKRSLLEHAGVLEVRTGSGTYVTEDALSKTTFLRVQAAATGQYSPIDIIIVRRALEPMSARAAAKHRTRQDIASLEKALKAHASLLEKGEDPSEPDIRFHRLLGGVSRNSLLQTHIDQVLAVLDQQMWRTMKGASLSEGEHASTYLREHQEVLKYIRKGDTDGAAEAMNAHLNSVEAGLLESVH